MAQPSPAPANRCHSRSPAAWSPRWPGLEDGPSSGSPTRGPARRTCLIGSARCRGWAVLTPREMVRLGIGGDCEQVRAGPRLLPFPRPPHGQAPRQTLSTAEFKIHPEHLLLGSGETGGNKAGVLSQSAPEGETDTPAHPAEGRESSDIIPDRTSETEEINK